MNEEIRKVLSDSWAILAVIACVLLTIAWANWGQTAETDRAVTCPGPACPFDFSLATTDGISLCRCNKLTVWRLCGNPNGGTATLRRYDDGTSRCDVKCDSYPVAINVWCTAGGEVGAPPK